MTIGNFFDSSMTVTRKTNTADAETKIVSASTTTLGPYPCRLSKGSGSYVSGGTGGRIIVELNLFTVADADIKAGDVATVGGYAYVVESVYNAHGHHIEATVRRDGDA